MLQLLVNKTFFFHWNCWTRSKFMMVKMIFFWKFVNISYYRRPTTVLLTVILILMIKIAQPGGQYNWTKYLFVSTRVDNATLWMHDWPAPLNNLHNRVPKFRQIVNAELYTKNKYFVQFPLNILTLF